MSITCTPIDAARFSSDGAGQALAAYETIEGRRLWIIIKYARGWQLQDGLGTLAGSRPATLGRDEAFLSMRREMEF